MSPSSACAIAHDRSAEPSRRGGGRAPSRRDPLVRVGGLLLLLVAAGCATRTPPPVLPTVLSHPEFLFPAVPVALQRAPGADRIDLAWRYLQSDDLRSADREFAAALKRNPGLYPAQAGEGYVALARRDHARALAAFDAALRGAGDYVPALVGRGQTLLALRRDGEALTAFEAALAIDASLMDLRRRIEVLQFRNVQQVIEAARAAVAAGRLDEARVAYERAITVSPDSAFLLRELGILERRQGNLAAALEHFRRAVALDATDAVSLVQTGEILEGRQDFAAAAAAYRQAAALEPELGLTPRIAAMAERAREAGRPAEFLAIPSAPQITRGELAALIGVRLESVLAAAPQRQVVVTDTRGHWAAEWITQVARAGVIEPFENHTFQPRAPVRRGDLAAAVSRVATLLAARDPALSRRLAGRPQIADMTPGHLSFQAVAVAVASGVMPLLEGDRFQVNRAVSGAEAVETITRLLSLAGTAPAPSGQ